MQRRPTLTVGIFPAERHENQVRRETGTRLRHSCSSMKALGSWDSLPTLPTVPKFKLFCTRAYWPIVTGGLSLHASHRVSLAVSHRFAIACLQKLHEKA